MIIENLMGAGMAALQAQGCVGYLATGLTATGSTQAGALALPTDLCVFTTTAASTGALLPTGNNVGDTFTVANYGANALLVYPPLGGKVQNGSANAGFSVGANKSAKFVAINTTDFLAILSA